MQRPRAASVSFVRRWLRRTAGALAAAALFYVCFLLLGFVPVNWFSQPPPADDCVTLWIRSNEIHTDVVVPAVHEGLDIDWRELFPPAHFRGTTASDPYVAFGWGSRAFYIETPTWADFKLSTAFWALFTPSPSVLHVEYMGGAAPGPTLRELKVSRAQYTRLAEFIRSTVGETDRKGAALPAGSVTYGPFDRFYEARGRYHAFNTCNQWTGRALAAAGVRTGIWTPLKWHVLWWLD